MGEATPLPCPFCGGEPMPQQRLRDGYEGEFAADPDAWAHWIACRACAATGGWAKSATLAVRWWNLRTTPSTKEDR